MRNNLTFGWKCDTMYLCEREVEMRFEFLNNIIVVIFIILLITSTSVQVVPSVNITRMDTYHEVSLDRIKTYYDVPLSHEIQDFARNQSEYNELPYELLLAVIEVESNFNPNIISSTQDYGLCQINISNHKYITTVYGITDFLDEKNNIIAGTMLLGTLYNKYDSLHKALMCYNYGGRIAKEYWAKGVVQSSYSRKVVKVYETYK